MKTTHSGHKWMKTNKTAVEVETFVRFNESLCVKLKCSGATFLIPPSILLFFLNPVHFF